MQLKRLITGIRLTVPIEALQRALAGAFHTAGTITLRRGAKYALAGEWWVVEAIDERGIRLEPVDRGIRITEAKSR